MTTDISAIRKSICDKIEIDESDPSRVRMFLPLTFGDGDHYGFAVEKMSDGRFRISDEGEAIARVEMYADKRARRQFDKKLGAACEFYGVRRDGNELATETESIEDIGESIFDLTQIFIGLVDSACAPSERQTPRRRERRELQILAKRRLEQADVWDDPLFHAKPPRLMIGWKRTGRQLPLAFDYTYGDLKFPEVVLSRALLTDPTSVARLAMQFDHLAGARKTVRRFALVGTKVAAEVAREEGIGVRDSTMSVDEAADLIGSVARVIDLSADDCVDELRSINRAD